MKRAIVRQRRRNPAGGELVCVVCSHCDGRHWLPAGDSGACPRRSNARPFAIAAAMKRKRASNQQVGQ